MYVRMVHGVGGHEYGIYLSTQKGFVECWPLRCLLQKCPAIHALLHVNAVTIAMTTAAAAASPHLLHTNHARRISYIHNIVIRT